ncbi:MAG: RagB/SusD family nutrient uptake outer membrane protein, partial [Bacteroidota bacterium]
ERSLDLLPLSDLTSEAFFQNENDYRLYANGLYGQLPTRGVANRDNWTDFHFTGGPDPISNSTFIEPETSGTWSNPYANIRSAFELIDREALIEPGALKDAVQVYKGEAHFFVAMNYFTLLSHYGGVPLIDKALGLEDELLNAPRASRSEIVDYILWNLDQAVTRVGTLSDASNMGRITEDGVRALKARVALFEGTWRKFHGLGNEDAMLDIAITESKAVMDSGNHSLFKNDALGDLSYFYFFILESSVQSNPLGLGKDAQNEYIVTRRHNKLDAPSGYISVNGGNLSPTLKLANTFLDNTGLPIDHPDSVFEGHSFTIDPVNKVAANTEYMNRDTRMLQNFIEPFDQFWYSVPYERNYSLTDLTGTGGWNEGYWTSASGYLMSKFLPEIEGAVGIDWPVIRLAEMMLIYAEAVFERNEGISDADLDISINKLRDRVDIPQLTNSFVAINNLDMRTEIRRERAVELMAEGFRYDDLRRWKTAETELNQALKGIQWSSSPLNNPDGFEVFSIQSNATVEVQAHTAKSFAVDDNGFSILEDASNRNFEQKHYLWPIPLREIELNPSLEQNPGWARQ